MKRRGDGKKTVNKKSERKKNDKNECLNAADSQICRYKEISPYN